MKKNHIWKSGLGALVLTIVSTVYETNLTPGLLGVINLGYGFPLSWLKSSTIVYPNAPTIWTILWLNFFFDILFWWLILGIILYALTKKRILQP